MAGLVLPSISCSRQVSTPAGYGMAYFRKAYPLWHGGTEKSCEKKNPEVAVWPDGKEGLEIHQRAFQKLGLPIEAVERIAIGYALNSSPVEMAMVLTGRFDEKALIAATVKAEKTAAIEMGGMAGQASRGVMLPVAPGRITPRAPEFCEVGIEKIRRHGRLSWPTPW